MNWLLYLLSFIAGAALGAFFTIGLWWTVRRITGSGRPYMLTVISFLARTTIVLAGFYLILQLGSYHILFALAGFVIARTILAYKLRPNSEKERRQTTG